MDIQYPTFKGQPDSRHSMNPMPCGRCSCTWGKAAALQLPSLLSPPGISSFAAELACQKPEKFGCAHNPLKKTASRTFGNLQQPEAAMQKRNRSSDAVIVLMPGVKAANESDVCSNTNKRVSINTRSTARLTH